MSDKTAFIYKQFHEWENNLSHMKLVIDKFQTWPRYPDKSNQSENVPHSPQKTPFPSKPTSKLPSRNETPAEAVWRMRERENVPHALQKYVVWINSREFIICITKISYFRHILGVKMRTFGPKLLTIVCFMLGRV